MSNTSLTSPRFGATAITLANSQITSGSITKNFDVGDDFALYAFQTSSSNIANI